jgi:long-chain fatty acid transport protein
LRHSARIFCIALLVTFLAGNTAFGSGFALIDFSARSAALGGAVVGRADDPSTLAFNPAGMTQIPGTAFMTSMAFLMPGGSIMQKATGISVDQRDHTFLVPSIYYTRQMNEKLWFGLGIMTRFGLGTDFPADWFGRYNSYRAMLESVSINPNVAWKVNDRLSLSVGLEALWLEADLRRMIDLTGGRAPSPATDMMLKLLGDDIGYGWNLGLHYTMDETTRIGLHYRSPVSLSVSGTATATSPLLGSDSSSASVDLKLPEMFMFGISKQMTPKLNVEAGAIYTGWSSYNNLTVNFAKPIFGVLPTRSSSMKNWSSVWRYQIGFEYHQNSEWTWRVGYAYDQDPMNPAHLDYQLPGNDRQLLSVGFGYTKNNRTWDFSYTRLLAGDRDIAGRPAEGVFDSRSRNVDADIFIISYSLRF